MAELEWRVVAERSLHPTQLRVLRRLAEDDQAHSPRQLADEFDEPLSSVSYHVKALAQRDLLELVATGRRRGGLQHFYRLAAAAAMPSRPRRPGRADEGDRR
jgi:DNA-binding transcriptional ArsR family regulator